MKILIIEDTKELADSMKAGLQRDVYKRQDKSISFEEVATVRPDGGQNICYASVISPGVKKPMYFDSMKQWCGPCWNRNEDYTLWQIDSEWSDGRVDDNYISKTNRILSILSRLDDSVSDESYAFLEEAGIMRTKMNINGNTGWFKSVSQAVWLENTDIKNKLIAIGDHIKEKYWHEFETLKESFVKAVLDERCV